MAAPLFPVNTHRHDPYRTFKFQVVIDGKVVAGLKKMGALKKKTAPVKWRASNDPSHERIMPGGTSYDPVTLERAAAGQACSFSLDTAQTRSKVYEELLDLPTLLASSSGELGA